MIGKLLMYVQAVRSAPPSRFSPLVGTALILVGVRLVQVYTDHQRKILATTEAELGDLVEHLREVRATAAPKTTTYPAPVDVDPLDRADDSEDPS